MAKYILSLYFLVIIALQCGFAQEGFKGFLKNKEGFKIEPFASFQFWSTYSMNHHVYNTTLKQYQAVDDRLNFMFRRARLGFRMQPYEDLRFNVVFAYDAVGRDVQAATLGATNNGNIPPIGIFDAFMEWRLKPKSEKWYLVAGFFRPQVSRESITPAWQVNSMEKSATQNYLRQHIVGVGPGRVMGANLGGLLKSTSEKFAFNYNFGVFNPTFLSNAGNSAGTQFAPLFAGRTVFSFGNPEMKQYGIAYQMNYFNLRKGLSIALDATQQGKTDVYRSCRSLGADLLLNWAGLTLNAEYHQLFRQGERKLADNLTTRNFTYQSEVGHLRAGYNLILGKKYFIEPAFLYMHFKGAKDAIGQADAAAVRSFAGSETTYDAGLNWYLHERRLKILLHYTWRAGDPGAAGNGATVNEFFNQPNFGAIRRGNWVGLGVNAIF